MDTELKPPFPYFGGKSRIADTVWKALGDVANYSEPFAGSAAVLLKRPDYRPEKHTETINDADGFVANFWRAIKWAPKETAKYADWPVSEADLIARNNWLYGVKTSLFEQLRENPEWFDPKIAGWWVWGVSCWVGCRYCDTIVKSQKRPHCSHQGMGIHKMTAQNVYEWFEVLSQRLRRVRVICGDWKRAVTPAVLWSTRSRITGVFLDPPYDRQAGVDQCYAYHDSKVSNEVREWCLENGKNQKYRIVLCGYEGEGHEILEKEGWQCLSWVPRGGFGNQRKTKPNTNRFRERIWLSPACLTDGLEVNQK